MSRASLGAGFLVLVSYVVVGQSTASRPAFDVTSVKPTPPERLNHLRIERCPDGGRFLSGGAPLMWAISFAYRMPDAQVLGAPSWVGTFDAAYDIEGKPEGRVTEEQCRLMLQSLLEDRFNLAVHRETKEESVYALVVGKNGSKLREVNRDSAPGGVRMNRAVMQSPSERTAPPGWTMWTLADYLTGSPGRPVIDKTGLPGIYAFSLDFSRTDTDDRPNVFTAVQEQLGLKLEAAKAPVEVLVIDHVEKPNEN